MGETQNQGGTKEKYEGDRGQKEQEEKRSRGAGSWLKQARKLISLSIGKLSCLESTIVDHSVVCWNRPSEVVHTLGIMLGRLLSSSKIEQTEISKKTAYTVHYFAGRWCLCDKSINDGMSVCRAFSLA
eukprot:scaffold24918_cov142-Cylindrotheca_fusiformis.AAC.2